MTKINENDKLNWVYLAGFFLILALPLLNISPWFSPSSWIQAILFRSLLAILVFIYLFKEKINFQKIKKGFNPKSNLFIPLVSLLAYFIAVFISTLTSLDVSFSLWGSPERGAGFVNFSFFILFFVLLFSTVRKEDWGKLLNFSLIIGFLVSLLAIFQQFGIFSNAIVSSAFRPASTLGNTIILALYLLPLFFISLSFFILETRSTGSGQTKIRKYLYLFLLLFFAVTIILISQTRAAFLGLLAGLFCFLIFYPLPAGRQEKKWKLIKIGAILLPIFIFLAILFLNVYPQTYENLPNFLEKPISRVATLMQASDESESARISVWRISFQSFLEKPYLGYGPENFYIAFNKNYNPNLPSMDIEKDFDRAHNYLIQTLVESGIFALVAYLVFFVSILWGLQKIKKQFPVANGLQAGFIALFVASLASIDGYAINIMFFFLSAYSLHLVASTSAEDVKNAGTKKNRFKFIRIPALIILFLILIIFLWQYNFVPLQMNEQLNVAQSLADNNWQDASKILDEQSKIKTFFLPFTNSIYLNLLIDRIIQHPEENNSLSVKVAQIAETNTKLQPYNYINWLRLGEALETINKENNNPQIAQQASEAMKEATKLSPESPTIAYSSFMNDISVNNLTAAKEESVYCLSKFPNSKECLWISGLINIYSNNIAVGQNFIEKSRTEGYEINNSIESENSLNQLAMAYLENKHYEDMIPIYQKLIILNPSQVQYKTSLMLAYKLSEQYGKARELAGEIIRTNPELKPTIENFLQSF